VPLLYGGIYLTASWDPYGQADELPVAVVNLDQPATFDGQQVNAGQDFVDNLEVDRVFDWRYVYPAEASRGLADGDYFMIVTVSQDFSESLVSGQGDDPRRAKVILQRDDANGFIVGSVTGKAQDSIENSINASATESYFRAVFANLAKIRSGMVDARDGAQQLDEGLTKAQQGSSDLAGGADKADQAADQISTGASTLATGTEQAKTGASTLATGLGKLDTASGKLADGADQVAAGTQQLNDKVLPPLTEVERVLPRVAGDAKAISADLTSITSTVAGRTNSIADDLSRANQDLAALAKKYPELSDDPAFARVSKRIDSADGRATKIAQRTSSAADSTSMINNRVQSSDGLTEKVTQARKDLTQLNNGAHQVAKGAGQLNKGIGTAQSGAQQLSTGATKLDDGADQLADGTSRLATGTGDLATGARTLDSGLGQLTDGAAKLQQGLSDGVDRIPTLTRDEEDKAVQVLSSPADVQMQVDHPAGEYGRGLAPLFFSIALWTFGISVFLVVRPISGRALAGRAGPIRIALTAWMPIAPIAVVASWLMVGVVWVTHDLDPVNGPGLILVATLGALAFSAVAHLLRTALGTVGSSILLVLLILQLASAGGTFPAPMLPTFFARIQPMMPMTYLIDAFRVVISGGQPEHLVRDLLVLTGLLLITLTLITLVVRRRQQFRMKDLHPPLVAP
ncbi:MAG: YhgE/Pip domain-containing protein, partial [Propionibacteriales bacterium]|nr:YhgE/Pip domain-containing protein [Propionibacteriales bacterium]